MGVRDYLSLYLIDPMLSLFRWRTPIDRVEYLTASLAYLVGALFLSPPLASVLSDLLRGSPPPLSSLLPLLPQVALYLYFALNYVGATARRLRDLGWTPWLALGLLVPLFNIALVLFLLLRPSAEIYEEAAGGALGGEDGGEEADTLHERPRP